ncbi:ribonuclease P protein component [Candidatus Gottesmanbacteria bacterium]|nr:ribonuclease P protein component [Candidatus Gottesmanbacteria bacterium]
MLPASRRVTYQEFRKNPNRFFKLSSQSFDILYKKSSVGKSRYVIITPKKLSKSSVRRHLAKRLITESLRSAVLQTQEAKDIMVKLKILFSQKEQNKFSQELQRLLSQIR